MADFCNRCSNELFDEECQPDIDVYEIAKNLTPGHFMPVLCEGCVMLAVLKDEDESIKIGYAESDEPSALIKWMPLSEWEALASTIKF